VKEYKKKNEIFIINFRYIGFCSEILEYQFIFIKFKIIYLKKRKKKIEFKEKHFFKLTTTKK